MDKEPQRGGYAYGIGERILQYSKLGGKQQKIKGWLAEIGLWLLKGAICQKATAVMSGGFTPGYEISPLQGWEIKDDFQCICEIT